MNPDLTARKRVLRLQDRDNAGFVPRDFRPGVIFRNKYPCEGPCAGCGKTFLKNSPSQKCSDCKPEKLRKATAADQ